MEAVYKEVRTNYQTDGFWTVDAWKTNDGDEEGKVIAVINAVTGDMYAIDQLDDLAKSVIDEKQTEIVCNTVETLAEIYNHLCNADKDRFLRLTENQ